MTTFNLTCEAVEATLPDYLDETLEAWVHISIEEHLGECVRCAGLARELRNITREASALPALIPEREIWPRIAGRIGAPVSVSGPVAESEPLAPAGEPLLPSGPAPLPRTVPAYALPGRREKRWGPRRMGLAAAALVLVTAGTTSLLTVQWLGRPRTPNVASDAGARRASSSERPAETPTPPPGQLGSALTVAATSTSQVTASPEEVVYDKEIKTLQRIVRRQKAELDASTVAVIEKNLRTLDSAIAQIRAALQKDPGSPLLGGQVSRALEMKVELLRRAAMLRSNTI